LLFLCALRRVLHARLGALLITPLRPWWRRLLLLRAWLGAGRGLRALLLALRLPLLDLLLALLLLLRLTLLLALLLVILLPLLLDSLGWRLLRLPRRRLAPLRLLMRLVLRRRFRPLLSRRLLLLTGRLVLLVLLLVLLLTFLLTVALRADTGSRQGQAERQGQDGARPSFRAHQATSRPWLARRKRPARIRNEASHQRRKPLPASAPERIETKEQEPGHAGQPRPYASGGRPEYI